MKKASNPDSYLHILKYISLFWWCTGAECADWYRSQ